MKEDKHLKELLQNNLVEETSAGFTESLMQRINVVAASEAYTRSLRHDKLFKAIAATFIFISILLLILNIPMQKMTISFDWKLALPSAFSWQIIQFLLVFWIVMIVNKVLSGRRHEEA
jgi:hypothetical protein